MRTNERLRPIYFHGLFTIFCHVCGHETLATKHARWWGGAVARRLCGVNQCVACRTNYDATLSPRDYEEAKNGKRGSAVSLLAPPAGL